MMYTLLVPNANRTRNGWSYDIHPGLRILTPCLYSKHETRMSLRLTILSVVIVQVLSTCRPLAHYLRFSQ